VENVNIDNQELIK